MHKLVRALDRILDLELPTVEDVGPSTLNIGMIDGGHAPNVIADSATAAVLVRLVGPSEETRRAIEALRGRALPLPEDLAELSADHQLRQGGGYGDL